MMTNRILFILLFSLLCSSCSHVSVLRLEGFHADQKESSCSLSVVSDSKLIKSPYEELCIITSVAVELKKAVENAKPEACKCGADGLLIMHAGGTGDGLIVPFRNTVYFKAFRLIRGRPIQ